VECGGRTCLVLVRILLCGNGLKHGSEIVKVKVRHWEGLLLQRLVYGSGGVNWRGYIVFVLLVMERIGVRMSNCRVLVQEGVELML
jgi:hypothetical protein